MNENDRDDKGRWLPGNLNTKLPRDERGRFISWEKVTKDIDRIISKQENERA